MTTLCDLSSLLLTIKEKNMAQNVEASNVDHTKNYQKFVDFGINATVAEEVKAGGLSSSALE